jgi:hypothetical protein
VLRAAGIGFALLLGCAILALFLDDLSLFVTLTGGIGVVCVLLSMIFSGALVSGDRMRANHATESAEDRRVRIRWTLVLGMIGWPNLVAAVLVVMYGNS